MFRTFRRPVRVASLLASVLLAAGAPFATALAASGDRDDALDCEALVQAATWDLRHEGKAGTFPLQQYQDVLAQRAERTARQVSYLRAQRGRDLDGAELQAEIERMARATKAPEALRKLFAALGNDPRTIGECLAKPLLVERLARQHFDRDERLHAPVRLAAERGLAAARGGAALPTTVVARLPLIPARQDKRVANPAKTAAEQAGVRTLREFNVAEWQIAPDAGKVRWSKLLEDATTIRALRGDYVDGRLVLSELAWKKTTQEAWWTAHAADYAPDYSSKAVQMDALPQIAAGTIAGWDRIRDQDTYNVSALDAIHVSTGAEVLIWGGRPGNWLEDDQGGGYVTRGLVYSPATDSWREIAELGAPALICGYRKGLWTGSRLLVLAGRCAYQNLGGDTEIQAMDGGLYDPVAETWQTIAPPPAGWQPVSGFSAVWSGTRAVFYGGTNYGIPGSTTVALADGAIYNPANNTWTMFSISAAQLGLPTSDRMNHQAIWAGSTMMVFGGSDSYRCPAHRTAFEFNPFSGVGGSLPTRVDQGPFGDVHWTGSKVLIYGYGPTIYCGTWSDNNYLSQVYDPATRTWSLMSSTNNPFSTGVTRVVGNDRLVVWGGQPRLGGAPLATGSIYRVSTNSWSPMASAGGFRARVGHQAQVVGNEVVIFGGTCTPSEAWADTSCRDAARFDAVANQWHAAALPPPQDGPPPMRDRPAVAGSATELYVWGGSGIDNGPVRYTDGAVYDSTTDVWTPMGATGVPTSREDAVALFANGRFHVFGGIDMVAGTPLGNGRSYDPVARSWSAIATPPLDLGRTDMARVFDGTRLVLWGGNQAGVAKGDGARWNPANNTWALLPTANAPSARAKPLAAGSGAGKTLVWRGAGVTGGAIYNGATDAWTAIPDNGTFPAGTHDADADVAAWLGDRFGILALAGDTNVLHRLDNATSGQWTAANDARAPDIGSDARARNALWTGTNLLVWGTGYTTGGSGHLGWLYRPGANEWLYTPRQDEPYWPMFTAQARGPAMVRMGSRTAVWGGHRRNSGSLWHDDTRTGALSVDVAVDVRLVSQESEPGGWENYYFDLVVTNHGPEYASFVTTKVDLDDFLIYRVNTVPDVGDHCFEAPLQTGPFWCEFDPLAPGQSRTVRMRLRADDNSLDAATVTGRLLDVLETDTNAANDVDTAAVPWLLFRDANVVEGDAGTRQLVFVATLREPAAWPVTFDIASSTLGSAEPGVDFDPIALTGVTIPAGQLSTTFSVTVHGDTGIEPNEVVDLQVTNLFGSRPMLSAAGVIRNDDTPTISIHDASVVEGDAGNTDLVFPITLSEALDHDVSFYARTTWSLFDTADYDGDYQGSVYVNTTIPAGQTQATLTVPVFGDTGIEADEQFAVMLQDSMLGEVTISGEYATGTILNDDGPALSIADVATVEGNAGTKVLRFTVSLSEASALPVTYDIATANGTAAAGSDYVARSLAGQTIPAGVLSKVFDVTLNGDTTPEANETVLVNVGNVAGGVLGDGQAVGTLANDDGPTLSIADVAITEGNAGTKGLRFTVSLAQASTTPVSYTIATADGTALAGSDYVARTATGQVIPAGALTRTFDVVLNGDTTIEPTETLKVNISNVVGAVVTDAQAIGTLTNDDGPSVSIGDVAILEGNAGTKVLRFTVSLAQVSASPVTYSIATANGTATAGSDYVARSLANQSIPAGMLSKVFDVTLNGDTAIEPTETLLVNLGNVAGGVVVDAQATGTITNDDGPTLSIADVATLEGNAGTKVLRFTVSLSQAAAGPVTFSIGTANGTATAGSDYVARSLANQSIPAGVLTKVFDVTLNGDTTIEANETFVVNLSASTGASILDGQATGTISNDDGPTVSIADVATLEGASGTKVLRFTVSLSQASASPVTYNIATANGTAAAGSDYVARSLANQSIAAGVLTKVFDVTLNGDTAVEANETLLVNLTNVAGGVLGDGQATGTITNDD